ncbi:hypothetical protein NX722_17000 [Endozoicomonas gorgoniicola]|uniref:Uncharacterized protein n=1 Tax=Endozoicomonas gorgoniicola TaxID=1234144 RepID=A0ABT3MY36_9GAMM|nr:hypothetical protein [Endozoicomonas gorgoniicola]MCW7554285.1 hypothetical protein [Endozoicomonas gorgoniicola]
MKNSFIANSVNRTVQGLLGEHNTLGTSFNLYSQKRFSLDQVHEKIQTHAAYPRLKSASIFLYAARHHSMMSNHNDYEAGRRLYDHCMTPYADNGIAANAHECAALVIYSALSSTSLVQVNRAIVLGSGDNPSRKILHEFAIIGEVTGNATCVTMPMDRIAVFLRKKLLSRSETPWAVDAAFNVVCPLKVYINCLGQAISNVATAEKSGQAKGYKKQPPLLIGPEVSPTAFYAMVSDGDLLAVEVTQGSERLNISENEGNLNLNDFF